MSVLERFELSVEVGPQSEIVKFNVIERVGTDLVSCCDLCAAQVEAIQPRKRFIELTDGTTKRIPKGPKRRHEHLVSIQEDRFDIAFEGRLNHKVFMSRTVILQPESRTWVTVYTPQYRLLQTKPYQILYKTSKFSASYGITEGKATKDFNIMIASFGDGGAILLNRKIYRC